MAKNAPDTEALKEAAPSTELQAVSELAVKHGQTFHKRTKKGELVRTVHEHDSVFKRDHLVADVRHGWTKSERAESQTVKLSDDDYLAAIEAGKKGTTHAPAMKRKEEKGA